jgi:vancomycin permeability regulator SanA
MSRRRRIWIVVLTLTALLAAVPMSRMIALARSNREPAADSAIVFGAKVNDDGTPSLALADRVDEGVRLYLVGRVHYLLMSGGVGRQNGISEARVMAARAVQQGVPRDRIWLDEAGNDTVATANNGARMLREHGVTTALLVTHYFHGPRAEIAFRRAGGHGEAVAAHMTRHLIFEPWYIAREIAGYYAVLVHFV